MPDGNEALGRAYRGMLRAANNALRGAARALAMMVRTVWVPRPVSPAMPRGDMSLVRFPSDESYGARAIAVAHLGTIPR
jgi:hypothetical protein